LAWAECLQPSENTCDQAAGFFWSLGLLVAIPGGTYHILI